MDPRLLRPTGNNTQFYGDNLPFEAYVQQTQAMVVANRIDLNSTNRNVIISANTPFIKLPNQQEHKFKRGILLIHGLYDCPFHMRELGEHFLARGFLVYSILLPGHGTVPGDLLHIQSEEWVKAVNYGVQQLAEKAEQIFICGFSLGAALAIHHTMNNSKITGLILLAPAIALQAQFIARFANYHKFISSAIKLAQWYKITPQNDYAKYKSHAFNAAYQIYRIINDIHKELENHSLSIPTYIALSMEDETVSSKAAINFFQQKTTNPVNRLLIYSQYPTTNTDKRIENRCSYYPAQKIIGFSHISLPISPENTHYGIKGDYTELVKMKAGKEIYLGALSAKNLTQHSMRRLSYNPDFQGMIDSIDGFIEHIPSTF